MAASRRKVVLAAARGNATARRGARAQIDPSFHRAVLKIALELRKPSARSCDAIVDETIQKMRLDPDAFRRYLGEDGARNMNLLLSAVRRFGP